MKKCGVTILEILVGLALLSLTLMFILNLVPGSILGLKISERRSAARQLAREHLCQAMVGEYPPQNQEQQVELNATRYRVQTRVENSGEAPNSKRIIVRVSWAENGRTGEVHQESVRAGAGE